MNPDDLEHGDEQFTQLLLRYDEALGRGAERELA